MWNSMEFQDSEWNPIFFETPIDAGLIYFHTGSNFVLTLSERMPPHRRQKKKKKFPTFAGIKTQKLPNFIRIATQELSNFTKI